MIQAVNLLAQYSDIFGISIKPAEEAMLIIWPEFFLIIFGNIFFFNMNIPKRLTFTTFNIDNILL